MLVHSDGLFARIRHPIYLGDMVLYAGLAVYPATWVSLVMLGVALYTEAFGEEHAAWRARTGRFWPLG